MSYLSALLHDPSVASVVPSSRYLAQRVVEAVGLANAGLVVELGPGDGVITRRLLRSMPSDGRLLAVERCSGFLPALRRLRDPRLIPVQGDALDLPRHLADFGLHRADAVVSGIPMSLLDPEERRRMVDIVRKVLRAGGRFVAYQVTPHLFELLRERFRRVEVRFELRNFPPLFVLSCRR